MSEEQLDAISEEVITPSLTPAQAQEPVILGEDKTEEAESSPASEDNHEQKHDATQKRINTLTAKRYEETRRADALELKLAEMEKAQAQPVKPVVSTVGAPRMPDDMYDSEAMGQYHNDMVAYSTQVAQQTAASTFEENQKAVQEQKVQANAQQVVSAYSQNAVRDGVDMDKLRVAEQMLNQSGISDNLGQYIMGDPNGGKIVEYLGDNPAEAYELLALDPVSAGIKIANEIKPRALSTTPRVSNAPEPTREIKGGGTLEKDDFERNYPGTTFI
jgi:hypothetical protein